MVLGKVPIIQTLGRVTRKFSDKIQDVQAHFFIPDFIYPLFSSNEPHLTIIRAVKTQYPESQFKWDKGFNEYFEKKKAAAEEKARLPKPYHPEDNAEQKINELINIAKEQKKNIILQAGGNWCIWCLRFNDFIQNNEEIRNVVNNNYLYYHLNWSPENKNEKIFASYGDPGKVYGYPVLLVLNSEGKLIHTQETGVLEDGKGYSSDKVLQFLEKWMYTE